MAVLVFMVTASLAEKALVGFLALLHSPENVTFPLSVALENLMITIFTLLAIGMELCIPVFFSPQKRGWVA